MSRFPSGESIEPVSFRVATLEETIAFITNTHNYREFNLTRPDFSSIYGCIEPRTELKPKGKQPKTVVQVAGGGAGEADTRAMAEMALTGEPVSVKSALILERELRGATSLGGHVGCKRIMGHLAIKQEEARPADSTMADVELSLYRVNREVRVMKLVDKIIEAANAQLEDLPTLGMPDDILDSLSDHYPQHKNIATVIGENVAEAYVVNYSQQVGLDRGKKAKMMDEGLDVQFYHESRGASLADLVRLYGTDASATGHKQALQFRLAAAALHASASQAVLTRIRPTEIFEVFHTSDGLQIVPQTKT